MKKDIQINTNKISTNNKDKIDKEIKSLKNNELINNNIIIDNNLILKKLVIEKYVNKDNLELYKYDELIRQVLINYEYSQIIKVTSYIINSYKQNKGLDEKGNQIINKFGYYKDSLTHNIEKINCEIDLDWTDDFKS